MQNFRKEWKVFAEIFFLLLPGSPAVSGNIRGNIPIRPGEDITGSFCGKTMVYCNGTEGKEPQEEI